MAADDFQKAKDPKLHVVYTRRGNAYAKKGQHDKAITEYSNALAVNPRYALAYYNRGVTHWNLKDRQQAIEDIRAAARLGDERAKRFLKSRGINW